MQNILKGKSFLPAFCLSTTLASQSTSLALVGTHDDEVGFPLDDG